MLKKTIKYEDFDGNLREEDYFFNITKSELAKLELSINGGITNLLNKIIQEKDQEKLINYFDQIIMMAYGEKSLDGKTHDKSQAVKDKFKMSAAYDALFMELISDEDAAANFVKAILPSDLSKDEKVTELKPV